MRIIINKKAVTATSAHQAEDPPPRLGQRSTRRRPLRTRVALALIGALSLGACATTTPAAGPSSSTAASTTRQEVSGTRLTLSYEGGVLVLDHGTLRPVADLPLAGFVRLNPAGDQRHVLISTDTGFRVMDTGVAVEQHGDHAHYYGQPAALTAVTYPAPKPGHAVRHAGKLALFSDGTGAVQVIDPQQLLAGPAASPTWTAPSAHHGLAVPLPEGGLLVSVGTDNARTGAAVINAAGQLVTESNDCPGVHGEAATGPGTIVVGCADGVLVFRNGSFSKIDSPDPRGAIGTQIGSPHSELILGDYKVSQGTARVRPTQISLVDTTLGTLRLVDVGSSYSFRSLGRGPDGEALVLGTDGNLVIIDPASGTITSRLPVVQPWTEPEDWQQPRPTLMVEGSRAYITEPASQQLHEVELSSGKVTKTVTLPHTPNEITGVGEASHVE